MLSALDICLDFVRAQPAADSEISLYSLQAPPLYQTPVKNATIKSFYNQEKLMALYLIKFQLKT